MKAEDWIKVEDRLPEAKYRIDEEKGYSELVLICGFRYTHTGKMYRFPDAAFYDYEYKKWYDKNDNDVGSRSQRAWRFVYERCYGNTYST